MRSASIEPEGQPADEPTGSVLIVGEGQWRVGGLIGKGSTSLIYEADTTSDSTVVPSKVIVKILRPTSASDPCIRERFAREASLLCALSHPGLVSGIAQGTWGDRPFIVEERCPGRPLSEMLAKPGGLGIGDALTVTAGLLAVLNYLYLDGRVCAHRDIKPANIMIDDAGNPKPVDLGIAKSHLHVDDDLDTGFLGTIAYMAPEQIDDAADIDIRVDLYALGAVFFEMLNGSRAFGKGNRREILAARLSGQIPRLERKEVLAHNRHLYDACTRIIGRALAPERSDRFQTPSEFLVAIRRAQEILACERTLPGRRLVAVALEAAAFICAAIGVGILLFIAATYLGADWGGFTLL